MYKCRIVYDEWKCLSIAQAQEKQIWKYNGQDVVVCDNGYKWLTILPKNEFYCITVMMDELDQALREHDITQEQYNKALENAQKLQSGLLVNKEAFDKFVKNRLKEVIN